MLLFSFCCFDFSFHGIQQEIETVDPLLILVNGPEQRISLPEQEPPQTVMIGDRMDTDMVAGIETGLDTVLVLSGVTRREDIAKFPYRPRLVLDGVGDIPGPAAE